MQRKLGNLNLIIFWIINKKKLYWKFEYGKTQL